MKIISWNVNGIRSVYQKNFLQWLEESEADIVCLQEIKAQGPQLPTDLVAGSLFQPQKYFLYLSPASKRGYSGIAVFSRKKPREVSSTLGLERFDQEGRVLALRYPEFTLLTLYLPHGGRQKEHLDYKLHAYKALFDYLRKLRDENVILAGDFNIAHQDIDLARPKENQNNTMFTPEERKQIDTLLTLGFVDSFRKFHSGGGYHTWWPYRAHARDRNLGWRIDYIFVVESILSKLKDAFILSRVSGSDHCPIGVELKI